MYPRILKTVLEHHGVDCSDETCERIWGDIRAMMNECECPDDSVEEILNSDSLDTFERGLFLDFMAKTVADMPHWTTNGDSDIYKKNFAKSMREGLKQYNVDGLSDD